MIIPGANKYCAKCWGGGVYRNAECPCVVRRRERLRNSLPSDWWRLWLDARREPNHFPPRPCLKSSLEVHV